MAALRIPPALTATLNRLGLRHIGELSGQPRAALARRFGKALVQRLDQALGSTHEPICPLRAPTCFAVRLSLPDPIGLRNGIMDSIEMGLARPSDTPERIRPIVMMKLDSLEADFGIDLLRLEAIRTEALHSTVHTGQLGAGQHTRPQPENPHQITDLIGRIGARIGLERIAPEWWLEDPNWCSGVRDYWQVSCAEGDQLWLFFAHGATISGGWFCHGSFA